MRRFFTSLIVVFSPLLAAADAWQPLKAPDGVKGTLRAVCFADAKNGWAVGDKGVCIATADGGQTWTASTTNSAAILRDVRFKDAQHGWICGDSDESAPEVKAGHIMIGPGIKNYSGTLLTTDDGGKTWKNSWVSSAFQLPSVEIATAPVLQLGVGGTPGHIDGDILRSNDGGKTWNGERSYRGLFDIRAIDDKRWVAVGAKVMVGFRPEPTSPLYTNKGCRALFSTDAGKTWSVAKGSDGNPILHRAASKSGVTIAVGDQGAILHSEDNGESWSAAEQSLATGAQPDLRSVAWSSGEPNIAVAVGKGGVILVSKDNGKSWKSSTSGTSSHLSGVCAAGTDFVIVGDDGVVLRASAAKL